MNTDWLGIAVQVLTVIRLLIEIWTAKKTRKRQSRKPKRK